MIMVLLWCCCYFDVELVECFVDSQCVGVLYQVQVRFDQCKTIQTTHLS